MTMSKRQFIAAIGCFGCYVSLDSRKFSTCRATSHLEHGTSSWHDIVLCMIVFVLAGAGCKTRFAAEQNPPPKPQGEEASGVCSANAPERLLYHSDRGTIGNGKQGNLLPPEL